MKNSVPFIIAFLILTVVISSQADAQKSTEIYIPIGESPGLSGYTKIGTVTSVDREAGNFVLADSLEQEHTVIITDSTSIWLDRSNLKKRNRVGSMDDITTGCLTEVKFYLAPDSTYLKAAEWVKIQVEPSE